MFATTSDPLAKALEELLALYAASDLSPAEKVAAIAFLKARIQVLLREMHEAGLNGGGER